jgi:anhydro-N-acetylmuramic acid kinase
MASAVQAIGLMSGTSLDGVDVAAITTDGERILEFGPTGYRAYAEAEKALLRQALADAASLSDRSLRPGALAQAETLVTRAHGDALQDYFADNGVSASSVEVVGFHGQTVLHRPDRRLTVQIGDGRSLARRIGVPVAFDFRAADVAAGGQGAPLVPVFHAALAQNLDRPRPIAVLNVGGVANVTYCDGDTIVACDTGPGNALLDDFMHARTGRAFDTGGAKAARGQVDEAFVAQALRHSFFDAAPPKSLDRNTFAFVSAGLAQAATADGAATLTAFTAAAVARVVPLLPRPPRTWVIAGGGAHNPVLLSMLGERLAPATVEPADALGWSGDALEAQAFAYLAVRTLRGLPITFPTTTGVARPMAGGLLARPGE